MPIPFVNWHKDGGGKLFTTIWTIKVIINIGQLVTDPIFKFYFNVFGISGL